MPVTRVSRNHRPGSASRALAHAGVFSTTSTGRLKGMKSTWRITALVLAIATTALAAVAGTASAAPAAGTSASATTIRIWADGNRKAAVERVAGAWARSRGVNVDVVLKEFGDIRTNLSTVTGDAAPDVIVGAHDWTGELAAGGLVVP